LITRCALIPALLRTLPASSGAGSRSAFSGLPLRRALIPALLRGLSPSFLARRCGTCALSRFPLRAAAGLLSCFSALATRGSLWLRFRGVLLFLFLLRTFLLFGLLRPRAGGQRQRTAKTQC
jgi:hypothetical protein